MGSNFKIPESVLVVVHTHNADVLLIKRVVSGHWQSITGSLDFIGESPEAAARRELCEETGIRASDNLKNWHTTHDFEIIDVMKRHFAPTVTHNKEHAFSIKLADRCEIVLNPKEHSRYVWLPFELAAEKMWSWTNRAMLQQIAIAEGWLET